ncbi:hypothetical protein RSOLAG22IIIB_10248 [Rhizoctonia solani]|uniref:Uncharacterized protein n=1 Tax=Rhizoctonia solani TaxID=456999 RepID=A0A0K6G2U9_9AGAM|nr:hypothetical protein RSOLAG22IIIB_10248 [Rhizoctonia solani]
MLTREDRPRFSQASPSSLPDSYDVGLTYDWSECSPNTVNRDERILPLLTSPSPSLIFSSPSNTDSDFTFVNMLRSSSDSKLLGKPLKPPVLSRCEQDTMNESMSEQTASPLTAISQSRYGRKLPMFLYGGTDNASSDGSHTFQHQTPLSSPWSLAPSLPPSPSSSNRTRPLFLPSCPSTPLPVRGALKDTGGNISTRKRKEYPLPSLDSGARRSKRQFTDSDVINIDDDEEDDDDDDDYDWCLTDTGYQSSYARGFSAESSAALSEALRSDSPFSTNRYSSTTQSPKLSVATSLWQGANGGAIKFRAKPADFNSKAFSRWSYSIKGPKNSVVDEHTEGDIHFSPSNSLGTNEPFNYWPHPLYPEFVLKPANGNSVPPKWVKLASFRSSRN